MWFGVILDYWTKWPEVYIFAQCTVPLLFSPQLLYLSQSQVATTGSRRVFKPRSVYYSNLPYSSMGRATGEVRRWPLWAVPGRDSTWKLRCCLSSSLRWRAEDAPLSGWLGPAATRAPGGCWYRSPGGGADSAHAAAALEPDTRQLRSLRYKRKDLLLFKFFYILFIYLCL